MGITPSQESVAVIDGNPIVIFNLNCPYPVKKGQVVETVENEKNDVTITFAPCEGYK